MKSEMGKKACKQEVLCPVVEPLREPASPPPATADAYMVLDSDEEMPAAAQVT